MLFSPTTHAFYDPAIHGDSVPNDVVEVTAERHAELLDGQTAGKRITAGADGLPMLADPPPLTIEQLAAQKRREIEAGLANALTAGMSYTMPDGADDVVQMQAEDRQNLLGLAIEARDLQVAGETGAVQEFRAASNTRYPMTPDQIIALTDAALAHYKALLQQSWDRKDVIDAALAAGDREGIEVVVW